MKNKWHNRSGIIGTIVFHLLLVFAFIILGMTYEIPPPEEQGVEVNFGFSEDGMGNTKSIDHASEESAAPQTSETEKNIITQNVYEAPTVKKTKQNKTKPVEDPQAVIDPNKLYKGKKQSGENEGLTNKPGNQGDPSGDPNAKHNKGVHGSGDNPSFSLKGRTNRKLPKPPYNEREQGKVVVTIWVDKKGNVTNAVPGAQGTTTTSPRLRKLAEQAAYKAKFSVKADAPELQKGTITYNFIKGDI